MYIKTHTHALTEDFLIILKSLSRIAGRIACVIVVVVRLRMARLVGIWKSSEVYTSTHSTA